MMSFSRSFAQNALFKGAGEVAIRLLSFAFMVWVARSLGREDFGILNFAYSFPLLFVVIVDFGLNPLLVRDVARDPGRTAPVFFHLSVLKLGLAAVYILAVGLGLIGVSPTPAMRQTTYWLAAFVLLNSFTEFINAVFHAHQRLHWEAMIMTLQKIALLGFGLLALALGWGVVGVAQAYLAAGVAGLIAALVVLIRGGYLQGAGSWDKSFWRTAWQQALPLTLTTLFINLYFRVDMTLLAKMGSVAELGWYGAAHKCIEVLMVIPAVVVAASFPGFSQLFHSDREKLQRIAQKVLGMLLVLGAPIAAGAAGVGRPLMTWLFGAEYGPAGGALALLAVALGFIFLNYSLSYLLIAAERQSVNAVASGLAVVVSVAANLLLIPRFGYLGAAGSAVLTEGFLLLAYALCVRRLVFPLHLERPLWAVLAATGAMLIPVVLLRNAHVAWAIAAGAVTYVAAAWLFKLIRRDDWETLRRIVFGAHHA